MKKEFITKSSGWIEPAGIQHYGQVLRCYSKKSDIVQQRRLNWLVYKITISN